MYSSCLGNEGQGVRAHRTERRVLEELLPEAGPLRQNIGAHEIATAHLRYVKTFITQSLVLT